VQIINLQEQLDTQLTILLKAYIQAAFLRGAAHGRLYPERDTVADGSASLQYWWEVEDGRA